MSASNRIEEQLAGILAKMIAAKEGGGKATTIHLFGLVYATDIDRCDPGAPGRIARLATKPSYGVEINKMLGLSEHVVVTDREALLRRYGTVE